MALGMAALRHRMIGAVALVRITGFPALITFVASREEGLELMRSAVAEPTIAIAAVSATSTILRWVARSAL
jgi:hypothetical protein